MFTPNQVIREAISIAVLGGKNSPGANSKRVLALYAHFPSGTENLEQVFAVALQFTRTNTRYLAQFIFCLRTQAH